VADLDGKPLMTRNPTPRPWAFGDHALPVHSLNTLVVGSGAAGRNAALQLTRRGVTDIAIATEKWNAGTSFDAGSDKQTYYKLALSGEADSPGELARDLWSGGCMHGDVALCEALGSTPAFFNLVGLGVPFPHDRHGAYPGYRTDNDPRGRASSAGPLTSRLMCQRLGAELERAGVTVLEGHQVVALLTREVAEGESAGASSGSGPRGGEARSGRRAVCGAVAIRQEEVEDGSFGLVVFNTRNVVLATGGPGGMYRTSVYPQSQRGALGMALRAGAVAQNITESQFGLASVGFRWNLSGSYQQVIPRYVSLPAEGLVPGIGGPSGHASDASDAAGGKEFLNPHFPDMATLAGAIFRKGYEWPFDVGRIRDHGSSLIDLLVFREMQEGRKVYLDFTRNPQGGDGVEPFSLELLPREARDYLERSGAVAPSPIARLEALNQPAVQLFRDHGIHLDASPLEIAVCAQHNNGGLRGSLWWESSLKHLFPVGEVCGTHGVRRPGGAALNAGQVGGMRAAELIAGRHDRPPPALEAFAPGVEAQVEEILAFAEGCSGGVAGGEPLTPAWVVGEVQDRMSRGAAHVRDISSVRKELDGARALLRALPGRLRVRDVRALSTAFWAADLCLTHWVFLEAIRIYLEAGGGSRGSAMVLAQEGELPAPTLEGHWRFRRNQPGVAAEEEILEVWVEGGGEVQSTWVSPRPIPQEDGWFEEVWKDFREGRVID
jgi:succinate dehydrogenase/fumarate reductase flavoprotein subunit